MRVGSQRDDDSSFKNSKTLSPKPLLLLQLTPATAMALASPPLAEADNLAAGRLNNVGVGLKSSWDSVAEIPNKSGAEFRVATDFILQMCANSYTYNFTDPDPGPLPPLIGWHLSTDVSPTRPSLPGAPGLRAFVYVEDTTPLVSTSRVVIVFRGWDVAATSRDELADLCAGAILFPRYADFLAPPLDLCAGFFGLPSLDYVAQAVAYTRLVLQTYPSSSVLLAGHSLGAGIAILVSAALQNEKCAESSAVYASRRKQRGPLDPDDDDDCDALSVVSFSSPGVEDYLNKQGWSMSNLPYVVTVSHDWDYFSVRARWEEHYGWVCVYDAPEPSSCSTCFPGELRSASLRAFKFRSQTSQSYRRVGMKSDNIGNNHNHDDQDDDDDCDYDDDEEDTCWDCLTNSHTPEAIQKAAANASLTVTCKFYGDASSVYKQALYSHDRNLYN
ncbi:hypothetical protein KP509_21G068800 [Ceratopteris richardii]|uniref:Fungal lipase-type domain-containing protein n=1 Tax=Ceratopteris richardii TaxID=49495 RepID=A0A8T2SEM8_CERRI|nr:hypothetical protein KP509_21G068800 [Ceratopteris richardii]KAH7315868.1 hypothetical protein KP509_21G068800 [Ceratopteris richardii]